MLNSHNMLSLSQVIENVSHKNIIKRLFKIAPVTPHLHSVTCWGFPY